MMNKLKLFFVAFKLLFDFIKKLFSNPHIEVHGDNNNINTSNNIRVDNSKHVSKNTTNNIVINEYYYPTNIPNVSYSPANKNDAVLNFLILFSLFTLSNNMIIYPHYSIFKMVTVILILTVIACNLHILLIYPKNPILIFQFVIIVLLSIKNLTIFIRFIPKLITIVGLFNDLSYFLLLAHFVSTLAFSIIIIIAYSKDIINLSIDLPIKPSTGTSSIIFLIILISIYYLPIISDFIINLSSFLIQQIQ